MGWRSVRVAVVVGRLVLLQFPLVSVAAVADPADVGLLAGVDPAVGDVSLPPEESFTAGPALVRKVSGVSPGMSVQLAPITKTFLTHRAVERSLAWTQEINNLDHPGAGGAGGLPECQRRWVMYLSCLMKPLLQSLHLKGKSPV